MPRDHFHFVTGRLAEAALRGILPEVAEKSKFDYSVQVLPITVAALMTPSWIAARLVVPESTTRILLPGYTAGDKAPFREITEVPVEFGPKDLRRLPEHFNLPIQPNRFSEWDIEIIAEINHAPRLDIRDIVEMAGQLRSDGATLIDVGCEPNSTWSGIAQVVEALKSEGHRISVDSLNPAEIAPAVNAGAELVLSVNSTNREHATEWGCEVVVIPDDIRDIDSMEETIEFLASRDIPFRIDPILEPIGLGFAASLKRYIDARSRWPNAELMMGIGNVTELTDVDSAGLNVLLLAICQELGIHSVLTTQVINWAQSSVRECDLARRLVHYSIQHQVPPKHLSDQLVTLRDTRLFEYGTDQLEKLAAQIKDNNYRIMVEQNEIHLLGRQLHLADADPFRLFDSLLRSNPGNLDASHAFYLGFEMCKALTANQLGKQYTQDESLDWGFLTVPESRHYLKKRRTDKPSPGDHKNAERNS